MITLIDVAKCCGDSCFHPFTYY